MNKEEVVKVYEQAVLKYNELADMVEKIYTFLKNNEITKVGKKKVLEDFDSYIQDLLVLVAFSDNQVLQIEFEFIKKIARYKDKYENIDSLKATTDAGFLFKIKELSDNYINEVPLFIKMMVEADKALEEKSLPAHYASDAYKLLKEILLSLGMVDLTLDDKEKEAEHAFLRPIRNYINKRV